MSIAAGRVALPIAPCMQDVDVNNCYVATVGEGAVEWEELEI